MVDYENSHEYEGMKKSMEAFSKEVTRLQDEREIYGRICDATVKRTNALAVEAYDGVTSFASLMSLLDNMSNDAVMQTIMQNEAVLEREGFTREDWDNGDIPAYVEEMLCVETEPDDYDTIAWGVFVELYGEAYEADSVLTDETKALLGPDYAEFVRVQHEQEAEKQVAEALFDEPDETHEERRLPDIPGNVICDSETGIMHSSLTDVYGNPVDDDFAFDEPV